MPVGASLQYKDFAMRRSASKMVVFVLLGCSMVAAAETATALQPETKQQRDARMAWWRDARFGMFIHWGLYCIPAGTWKGQQMSEIGEWIMSKYRIPISEYSKLADRFNPVKFDADQWARIAKQAGMRYMIVTAKHADGFAMYHSKCDPYNVFDATPFHRDPVAELAAACQKHGLKFGFYYSQAIDLHERDAGGIAPSDGTNAGGMDWGNSWDFPDCQSKRFDRIFEKKVKPQLQELLTGYGPISAIWFDNPIGINRAQSEELYHMVRRLQPGCIMNSRLGNDQGDYDSEGDNVIPTLVVPKMSQPIDKAYLLADATKKALPISNTEKGPTITLPAQSPDAMDSVVVLEIQGERP
jgi:alpha-L-fucosidase